MKRLAWSTIVIGLFLLAGCAEREKAEPAPAVAPIEKQEQAVPLQKLKGLPVMRPMNAAPVVGGGAQPAVAASSSASAVAPSASVKPVP